MVPALAFLYEAKKARTAWIVALIKRIVPVFRWTPKGTLIHRRPELN